MNKMQCYPCVWTSYHEDIWMIGCIPPRILKTEAVMRLAVAYRRRKAPVPFNRKLGVPQVLSGRDGEEVSHCL
jgi:hypothetical protein